MPKNREGYEVDIDLGTRECTNCGVSFAIASATVTICPSCNVARVRNESTETKMYRRAKHRSKKNGTMFDITVSDIHIPDICPILEVPLIVHEGSPGGRGNSPSLDRINNSLGYTSTNIQVISHRANAMKADATKEELLLFAKWIRNTYE